MTKPQRQEPVRAADDGVVVRVKVVPGASVDRIDGLHGDRIKVRVRAAPERGKANRAVCMILVEATDAAGAEVVAGHGDSRKTVLLTMVDVEVVRAALSI